MPRGKILQYSEDMQLGEFVSAIGVFDGMHSGHRFILGETMKQAHCLGLPAIAITFDRDPDELFLPKAKQRKLLNNTDRITLLAQSGIDAVLVLPFGRELASVDPDTFLCEVIAGHGNPRGIHVGSNFRFGCKATGTVDDMRRWGEKQGCEVFAHELSTADNLPISATRIRDALEAGDIGKANALLGRPYYMRAVVTKGRGCGRDLGFPTANLAFEEAWLCPADGVYVGAVGIDGKLYKAAISVGVPATFADVPATVEAHIVDFDGDLYGRELPIFFCEYVRSMQAFSSVDELIATVHANIEQVRTSIIPKSLKHFLGEIYGTSS